MSTVRPVKGVHMPKWIPIVLTVAVCTSVYLGIADKNLIEHNVHTSADGQLNVLAIHPIVDKKIIKGKQVLNKTDSGYEKTTTQTTNTTTSNIVDKMAVVDKEIQSNDKETEENAAKPKEKTPKVIAKAPTEPNNAPEKLKVTNKAPAEPRNPFPSKNLVEDFPTVATREEARRHDRVVVDSMAYFAGMEPKVLDEWNIANLKFNASELCINIFTSNRKIRYVDALLMMLMKGNSKELLLSYAKINLLNIERRAGKVEYPHLTNTLSKFDFLSVYNITAQHPLSPDMPFLTALRLDTISGLDICVQSKLPFCLMLEDDALPALGFIDILEKSVIAPLRNKTLKASSVSLYSYHSHAWTSYRLDKQSYIDTLYNKERSKSNAERFSEGLDEYVPTYKLVRSRVNFGAVANIYTLEMATKLRDFLKSYGKQKKVANADHLMNQQFVKKVNVPRMQIEPSLVNHIGFYSERRNAVSYLNSDVRFQLDAGEYN